MKKIFIIVVLVTLISMVSPEVSHSRRIYCEGNGWRIPAIKSGRWLLNVYPKKLTSVKPFRYIRANDPSSIICFVLEIDKGIGLQLLPDTKIVFKYLDNNEEEHIAISKYCFLVDTQEEDGIRRCDEFRYTALPNTKGRFFTTPREKIVLFAKFNFNPEARRALSCEVPNLNVIGGE